MRILAPALPNASASAGAPDRTNPINPPAIRMNVIAKIHLSLLAATLAALVSTSHAEIGVISAEEAKKLIENADPKQRPIVFDTRGGYKDYFRGHLPTAHHL